MGWRHTGTEQRVPNEVLVFGCLTVPIPHFQLVVARTCSPERASAQMT